MSNTVEDTALGKLTAQEVALEVQQVIKFDELAEAERAAGEAYANGSGGASTAADRVVRLQAEMAAIDRAIVSVRAKRPATILAAFQNQAKVARASAAAKRSELESLSKKTARLLAELAGLEGAEGRFLPTAEPGGGVRSPMKSEALAREIAELEQRARELDATPVPDRGGFDSEESEQPISDDAIVISILQYPSIGPSAAEIRSWLAAVERETVKLHPDRTAKELEQLPRRVHVEWEDGKIDIKASFIFVRSLAIPVISPRTGERSGFDTESAMFRAQGVSQR